MTLDIVWGRKAGYVARCVEATVEELERRTLLSGLTGTSSGFDVTDQLVFTPQPANMVKVGAPLIVQVKAEDGAGNIDPSFNDPVTLTDRYSRNYNSPLNGTLTVHAVNGVATFTGISQDFATANTYYNEYDRFIVNSGKLPEGTSNDFALYEDRLVFLTQPPTDVTAGSPFDVQIEAVDLSGNFDNTFGGIVVLSDHYASNGGILNGRTTVRAVDGIATFTGITQDNATDSPFGQQLGKDILYAYGYDSGMPNNGSHPFTIHAAAPSQLVITHTPFDTRGDGMTLANAPLTVRVQAEDAYGNPATSFSGDITLTLANHSNSVNLGGTTTLARDKRDSEFHRSNDQRDG